MYRIFTDPVVIPPENDASSTRGAEGERGAPGAAAVVEVAPRQPLGHVHGHALLPELHAELLALRARHAVGERLVGAPALGAHAAAHSRNVRTSIKRSRDKIRPGNLSPTVNLQKC